MREVASFELYTFVNSCYDLTMLLTFGGAFRKLAMCALDVLQGLLFTAKETGVLNFFCIGEGCKGFESYINPYLCAEWVKTLGVTLTRKGDLPLAGTALMQRGCLDDPTHRTMVHHFDGADFGERHTVVMRDAYPRLRIAHRVIASVAFETGIAWLLTCFDAAKERLHAQINTYCDILQHLRMNGTQRGTLFFQHRIGGLLPITTQVLALLLIRCFAVLKQVVIEPSALFKRGLKRGELFFGWVNPILKVLYHTSIVAQFTKCQALRKHCMYDEYPAHHAPKGRAIHPHA